MFSYPIIQKSNKKDRKKHDYYGKPLVIPIFIPHMGCPHRCIFCDQGTITGTRINSLNSLQIIKSIDSSLQYFNSKRSYTQVSFYGGNFLGLPKQNIRRMLESVTPFIEKGKVDSIRFSTRPDTITFDNLSVMSSYLVKTVELGVQSMDDGVLRSSQRGHTANDTRCAVDMLKSSGYNVGIQMMIGLPDDTKNKAMKTAEHIAALSPNFVRIYPTIIIRGSLLSTMYKEGLYNPLKLNYCVSLTKQLFLFFREYSIPVVRMGLQASEDLNNGTELVTGPYHPAFGHMVYSEIFLDAIRYAIFQTFPKPHSVSIKTHPKNVSRVQGLKCSNIEKIKEEFNLSSVTIKQDDNTSVESLTICGKSIKVF